MLSLPNRFSSIMIHIYEKKSNNNNLKQKHISLIKGDYFDTATVTLLSTDSFHHETRNLHSLFTSGN